MFLQPQLALLHGKQLNPPLAALEYLRITPRYNAGHRARHVDIVDVNYALHLPGAPPAIRAQTLMAQGWRKSFTDHVGAGESSGIAPVG